jgi:6-phosphogluconate dehydrogenase
MQMGLIGLGRMGAGMAQRLLRAEHAIVGFDMSRARVEQIVKIGAAGARSLQDLTSQLAPPRAVWVMVPHATRCREQRVHFLDVGVSGGVWGLAEGFNLHVGPSGAGHFVKMIHNAIEYAMLQALGEGFECLKRSEFNLDLTQIAALWEHGAVVRSWLLSLLGRALTEEGNALEHIADYVDDSGTGRWTVEYALAHGIPVPGISVSLSERFDSRTPTRFAHQVIAALRKQFGGHAVREG